MMDLSLRDIAAIYPRPLRVEYYKVMATKPDAVSVAIDKLRHDVAAWVKPEDVQAVLEGVNAKAD